MPMSEFDQEFDYSGDNIQEFYANLLNICTKNKFFFVDQDIVVNDNKYKVRIFNYHHVNWEDWKKHAPYSYWCRGTTFELLDNGRVRLVSLPFRKFFNYNENESTTYKALEDKQIVWVAEKHDGSLISTVNLSKDFTVKSKGSFNSEQALAAQKLDKHSTNLFIDYEYVAPNNQIVVQYDKSELIALESRYLIDNEPRAIVKDYQICQYLPELKCYIVTTNLLNQAQVRKFGFSYYKPTIYNIEQLYIQDRTDFEGVVVTFKDGTKVKYKTDWYCNLHKFRDQVNNIKFKLEVILNDSVDDLLSKLNEDMQKEFIKFKTKVEKYIEEREKSINDFIWNNEKLSRKQFAIKAREELKSKYDFSCVMDMYSNPTKQYCEFDFRVFMKENIDKFVHNNELKLE